MLEGEHRVEEPVDGAGVLFQNGQELVHAGQEVVALPANGGVAGRQRAERVVHRFGHSARTGRNSAPVTLGVGWHSHRVYAVNPVSSGLSPAISSGPVYYLPVSTRPSNLSKSWVIACARPWSFSRRSMGCRNSIDSMPGAR